MMAELSNEITELLAQAIKAIQYGHKSTAAVYLNRILEKDPDNMDAWRWLAECMPNASKREYCLQRAGFGSTMAIPRPSFASEVSTISDHLDPNSDNKPKTLAEQHVRRNSTSGQSRAELPPKYQKPILRNLVSSVQENPGESEIPRIPEPVSSSVIRVRKQIKRKKKEINPRLVSFGICVTTFTVLMGYLLSSTGLTSYNKVIDWVSIQIENNAAYLPSFGSQVSPTPGSLYDQPAEEPDILATYMPPQSATPSPDEFLPAPGAIPEDSDIRTSAENPDGDNEGSEPSTSDETSPTPTGYVDGPIIIGTSIKGNNIEVMQFGNGPIERMMVAGVHGGNEWNTTALADELIDYLLKNPQVIPADRTLYILRLLNPDGEERGHNLDGRTNERGVDLNRNWDAFWKADWDREGCWNYRPISAGSEPFSEPETAALRDFLLARNVSALINYHSAALGVFAGGRPPETESINLAKSISAVTSYAYPPMDTGCDYTGQFADWLAMRGTAAVDLELTNHTDTDFDQNLKVLDVLLKWEPSTGPKSLTGLINLADSNLAKPGLMDEIKRVGTRTINEINGLIFGRQEEK
jgi:predicted deacylase